MASGVRQTEVQIPGLPGTNQVAVRESLTFAETVSLFVKQKSYFSYRVVVILKDNIVIH